MKVKKKKCKFTISELEILTVAIGALEDRMYQQIKEVRELPFPDEELEQIYYDESEKLYNLKMKCYDYAGIC